MTASEPGSVAEDAKVAELIEATRAARNGNVNDPDIWMRIDAAIASLSDKGK